VSVRAASARSQPVRLPRPSYAVALDHLRLTMAVLTIMPTLWLVWLVYQGRPLPFPMRSAALLTIVFCLWASATVLWLRRLPILSFPSLFLAVTFLFTCSPLLLFLMQGIPSFSTWETVDLTGIARAMPVVMLAFSAFLFGALLLPGQADEPSGPPDVSTWPAPTPRERALRAVGFGLYGATALVIVASSVLQGTGPLSYAVGGGYSAYHGAKRSGAMSQFVGVSVAHLMPWALLILVATSRDHRSRRLAVLLALPFVAVMLAVGDRGGPIATIAIVGSGLYLVGGRINFWKSAAIVAMIAFLIPTILNLRQLPISQWSGGAIASAASNQVQATHTYGSGPIQGFLVSMSSVYQTLMATVDQVPDHEPYHLGSDYLASMVVAVPFRSVLFPTLFGTSVNRLAPSDWVLNLLHPGRNAGLGYLQVAEAYLEFGAVGVLILYLLLGWVLTSLWRSMRARASDALGLAFSLIVVMETMLWIRNSSSLFVRAVAWGFIVVYALPTLLARRPASTRRIIGARAIS
jgi:O-antigen polysaccharide polymerase Wzy-like protein